MELDGSTSLGWGYTPRDRWTLTAPAGSAATLSSTIAARPWFTADVDGTCVATLVVTTDAGDSAPDGVVIVAAKVAPTLDTAAREAYRGETVTVTAAAQDASGDTLSFAWTLLLRPAGSAATLACATTAGPRFVADVDGRYEREFLERERTVAESRFRSGDGLWFRGDTRWAFISTDGARVYAIVQAVFDGALAPSYALVMHDL